MGVVTGISSIRNNSQFEVQVEHNEDNTLDIIQPGTGIRYGRRVPYANNQTEFNARHIAVRLVRPEPDIMHAIWQRRVGNEDLVRSSRNEETARFDDPGSGIPGDSTTGGNKALFIDANSNIFLDPSS